MTSRIASRGCVPIARSSLRRTLLAPPRRTQLFSQLAASLSGLQPHFDYKYIRNHKDALAINAHNRNIHGINFDVIVEHHQVLADLDHQINQARNQRNDLGRQIGAMKRKQQHVLASPASNTDSNSAPTSAETLVDKARQVREQINELEHRKATIQQALLSETAKVPNTTHPTTPIGAADQARLVKQVKSAAGQGRHPLRDHVELCKMHDLVDFQAGANVVGTSFYYLQREGALLELALVQYAVQMALAHGFSPVLAPDLVRQEVVHGCGFQPRKDEASQTYYVSPFHPTDSTDPADPKIPPPPPSAQPPLCLTATAEIPLAGKFMNQLLPLHQVPQKLVAFGHCFRAEAGAHGADTRGLYRVHQFSKVELFAVVPPQQSDAMLEEIRQLQEAIVTGLGLGYRVLDMPTEELGASAYKKYDIEAWMPGRNAWGEISSASNCTDYQARRLNIRCRSSQGPVEFAHTLNGTACAIPRLIIAILETFQQADGTIPLPKALHPWLHGITQIPGHQPLASQQQ
ncbi:Serine--tRNA ligase, mitochondrial [Dimargaris verticillata]|uniref:serine--tRNA ligase n=1 Tax=Dimargaris verticillata TaxID=2761393 RepID=A0A9W8B4A7_9FUNG|nr:Serine--tRNA ligase, mitochondrial [Dimargaris verticillata]